jgi:hypothetical protein
LASFALAASAFEIQLTVQQYSVQHEQQQVSVPCHPILLGGCHSSNTTSTS